MTNYIHWLDFLPANQAATILRDAIASERQAVAATVTTQKADYRQGQVVHDPDFADYFQYRLLSYFPEMCRQLGMKCFGISRLEVQFTAYGDGDFFKRHSDNGDSINASRKLSYCYYFFKKPKQFSGGQLLFELLSLEPTHNSIVFFPSDEPHEVRLVSSRSREFEDSRFSLNGWIS